MKSLRLLYVALLSAAVFSAMSNQFVKAQEASPTLADTLRWLSEKTTSYAFWQEKHLMEHGVIIWLQKITPIRFDNCMLIWRETQTTEIIHDKYAIGLGVKDEHELKIDFEVSALLGDLDPSNITIERKKYSRDGPAGYVLILYALNEKPTIRYRNLLKGEATVGKNKYAQFYFAEEDMATRFSKALAHAITLCKGKKEPF